MSEKICRSYSNEQFCKLMFFFVFHILNGDTKKTCINFSSDLVEVVSLVSYNMKRCMKIV